MRKSIRFVMLISGLIALIVFVTGCWNIDMELWIEDRKAQKGHFMMVLTTDNLQALNMLKGFYYDHESELKGKSIKANFTKKGDLFRATFAGPIEPAKKKRDMWEGTFASAMDVYDDGSLYRYWINLFENEGESDEEVEEFLSILPSYVYTIKVHFPGKVTWAEAGQYRGSTLEYTASLNKAMQQAVIRAEVAYDRRAGAFPNGPLDYILITALIILSGLMLATAFKKLLRKKRKNIIQIYPPVKPREPRHGDQFDKGGRDASSTTDS